MRSSSALRLLFEEIPPGPPFSKGGSRKGGAGERFFFRPSPFEKGGAGGGFPPFSKGGIRRWLTSTLAASVLLTACQSDDDAPPTAEPSLPIFTEEAADRGLDFVHFNGMSGELYLAEVMGSGVGLFDYDNDGDLDVYLVQGALIDDTELDEATFPPAEAMRPLSDRLYRNDLEDGELRFTEVRFTEHLSATGYGMGVATGDVDNDGWIDIYVTNLGPNQLLRNRGDGTFEDVTARSGTDDPRWSVSATFVDFDRDGWLDLYVTNYVDFTVAGNKRCKSLTGAPDYCGPISYRPQGDRLLRNRGDGRFEDVSVAAGIAGEAGSGLGVVSGDLDRDGRPDLYVANDGMPNRMWLQHADARFRDEGLNRGSALSLEGMAEAGMGVAASDADGDGDEDLLITHLALETNTLYLNDGAGFFDDATVASGLGTPSYTATGFGVAFLDLDNDGRLDVMAANGAVKVIPELAAEQDPYPVHMPNLLFRNLGAAGGSVPRFEHLTSRAGEGFGHSEVSRGLAAGDLDNDGDTDVVISNNSGPVRLLINQLDGERHWLGLRLVAGRRDALGALVAVEAQGAPTLWRRVRTGGSYLSASDPRLLFGLDGSTAVESVTVEWPSGKKERFEAEVDRYTTLVEGSGIEVE